MRSYHLEIILKHSHQLLFFAILLSLLSSLSYGWERIAKRRKFSVKFTMPSCVCLAEACKQISDSAVYKYSRLRPIQFHAWNDSMISIFMKWRHIVSSVARLPATLYLSFAEWRKWDTLNIIMKTNWVKWL